jgi:hypothetical protein
LRKAGSEDHTPRGLLARAAFRRDIGEWDRAQEDLAEVHEIASRGGMRLFLADYQLERARLLLAQIPGVTPPDEWTLALARAAADAPPAAAESSPAAASSGWMARLKSAVGLSSPPEPRRLDQAKRRPGASSSVGSSSDLRRGPLDPTYRPLVVEADNAWGEANALVQATGYHRRDAELAALRATIDELVVW